MKLPSIRGRVSSPTIKAKALLIRVANLRKLFGVYDVLTSDREDRTVRSDETLWGELRKFVAHTREARYYDV